MRCSIDCYSWLSPLGSSIISSSISSGLASCFNKSRRLKIRLFDISLSLFTRFSNLTLSSTIFAKSSENASADSENSFVLWDAFLTCDFLCFLSSSQSVQTAGLSSCVRNWYLLLRRVKFRSSISTDWLLLSCMNIPCTSPSNYWKRVSWADWLRYSICLRTSLSISRQ